VNFAVFYFRAWRWKPLLEPLIPASRFRSRFSAVTIGFMANNLLPARIGEFARAYALSRSEPIPVSASLASLVVERLFDGIFVVLFLLIAMGSPGFPTVAAVGGRDVGDAAAVLGAVFGVAIVVLLATVLWPRVAVALFERTAARFLPERIRDRVTDVVRAFLSGLGVLRHPGLLLRVAGWSAALWLVNALSFWIGIHAFGLDIPFVGAVFLQSAIALAVSVPLNAPGFFGLFEAGVRFGLVDVWGADANHAVGFAIVFHIATFIPVTAVGLWYASRLGLTFGEVSHSEEAVEEAASSEWTVPRRLDGDAGEADGSSPGAGR
jgi:glycosyltransferase 2 family protein